ncbi:Asp23/Gls24 family envelope stress response protein [Streptomyces spiramyceticus]|uniref:Asp23/Gls24 family envelope stress response protein n=1 Tax=Streptomyces spiramyceticus TaxID=299717 RepID=UPI00237A987A|nr:Asp23/Gls24 family envelope stress response protein [Streptomyces spiramyceticus]
MGAAGRVADGQVPAGEAPAGRVAAAERGATRIADRVVAKIAAQAAREALAQAPDDQPGRDRGKEPHAAVTVRHDTARVRISLELGYPSDIGGQCGTVRRQVAQRVKALAGMEVPEVSVQVERLHSASQARRADRGRIR